MQPIGRFIPGSDLAHDEMIDLQREVASAASFEDVGDVRPDEMTIAGIDQAFIDDETVVSGVVVWRDGDVLEERTGTAKTPIPYIPGLLAFRELAAVIEALREVQTDVDVLLVDGNGRIHPRGAGLATHIGVVFDIPAVGVAKSLLCGDPVSSISGLDSGEQVPIVAEEGMSIDPGTVIGYAVQTRQFDHPDRHINPIYVSPGHRVSAVTAVHVVKAGNTGYKLPGPLRCADTLATQVSKTEN